MFAQFLTDNDIRVLYKVSNSLLHI